MSYFHQDSVFWIEVDKIDPNPYQPRKEFDSEELQSLASSIRQYGVLQALVVTRQEFPKEDGGLLVKYELISGERRLRAAKLSGVKQVPVLIRSGEENDLMKLELAIIENLQREDLNVVERARAFDKLAEKFSFNKTQIAKKVGKSREYVSNTMRVLSLPDEILDALSAGKLSEGHARPLMMLCDKKDEQQTLFKEILYKRISVREAERIAKKVAKDKVRKPGVINPEIEMLEREFTESLGTRVNIESKEVGGKISIDYFSKEDLHALLDVLKLYRKQGNAPMLENFLIQAEKNEGVEEQVSENVPSEESTEEVLPESTSGPEADLSVKKQPHESQLASSGSAGLVSSTEVLEERNDLTPEPVGDTLEEGESEKVGIWEKISTSFGSFNDSTPYDDKKEGEDVEQKDEKIAYDESDTKDTTPETFAGVTSYESTEYLRSEEPERFNENKEDDPSEEEEETVSQNAEGPNSADKPASVYGEDRSQIGREGVYDNSEDGGEGYNNNEKIASDGPSSATDYDDDDLYSVRNFSI